MASYDSTNMRITDLAVGFLFEYDLKNWEVLEEFEYDWGDNYYTKEFKITDRDKELYLELEQDDELKIAIWEKVSLLALGDNIPSHIISQDAPPRTINYNGIEFHRTEESLGYFRNVKTSDWSKFVCWDFESRDGKNLLSIERWGEEEFEASIGHPVPEFKFSNVLPREGSPKKAPRDIDFDQNKRKKNVYALLIAAGLLFVLFGMMKCGSGSSNSAFNKNPVDEFIASHPDLLMFTIVLQDMDVDQSGWGSKYKHKYNIVQTTKDSVTTSKTTDFQEVSKSFFTKNQDNLGMEIASKGEDGKITKTAAPAGYSSYIGNERYGHWSTNSRGESFWSFYGRYMFMSTMFNMAFQPAYRNYYTDYRSNYYGRRPYYGPSTGSSGRYYGTNSSAMKQARPDFFQRKAAKNGFSSSRSNSRTSRSSSRYSSSSSRSRSGGGFGK